MFNIKFPEAHRISSKELRPLHFNPNPNFLLDSTPYANIKLHRTH